MPCAQYLNRVFGTTATECLVLQCCLALQLQNVLFYSAQQLQVALCYWVLRHPPSGPPAPEGKKLELYCSYFKITSSKTATVIWTTNDRQHGYTRNCNLKKNISPQQQT
eukprot:6131204-Amphidinium_carterae.1